MGNTQGREMLEEGKGAAEERECGERVHIALEDNQSWNGVAFQAVI